MGGGCWVDTSARTLPSAGHRLGQSPLLGHPSSELLVSVSLDGADGKQTKGCYGVMAPTHLTPRLCASSISTRSWHRAVGMLWAPVLCLLPKEGGHVAVTYLGPEDSSVLLGLLSSSRRAELPGVANPKSWRGHSRLSQADSPVLLLVPCHSKAAGCLPGARSAGEGSNPAQQGTTARGCWRWAPSHRCRDIILPPWGIESKVQELFGKKL